LAAASLRLYSDWTPTDGEAGTLALTLNNLSDRPLGNFRLAFTSRVQIQPRDGLVGASLLEQLSGYHVIAPPAGFVLKPGAAWSITADRLNDPLRHYGAAD
jgi:hexosaminidase